jgi:hypothetical protein
MTGGWCVVCVLTPLFEMARVEGHPTVPPVSYFMLWLWLGGEICVIWGILCYGYTKGQYCGSGSVTWIRIILRNRIRIRIRIRV